MFETGPYNVRKGGHTGLNQKTEKKKKDEIYLVKGVGGVVC